MGEKYRVMEITGEPDETLRWVLLKAAGNTGDRGPLPVGYPRDLTGDLSRFVPFLPPLVEPGCEKPLHLLRLYAFITDETSLALIAGDRAEELSAELRKSFPETVRSAERTLSGNGIYLERDWGLIGMALPGWIVLFSDDADLACRMSLEGGIRAAFLPAREEWLNRVGPEVTEEETLKRLLTFFFESLPEQEA